MCIWWWQTMLVVLLPTTTHISSFITVAHTELWIFYFLLLANQNRYANEVLNIWWWQITWVVLVPITTHIPRKSVTAFSLEKRRFTFDVDEKPTSVHKHLKKSNAACFYTPIVLKLFIIVQMWKQHEEGNLIAIILTPHLSKLIKYW